MKIVICGSMTFKSQIGNIKTKLESVGHEVVIPQGARVDPIVPPDEIQLPHDKRDEFHYYYKEIKTADAVLIVNFEKRVFINGEERDIPGYIGGNTLIEMAFAYVLGKMMLLMDEVPPEKFLPYLAYLDEINRMRPYYVLAKGLTEQDFRAEEVANLSSRKWHGTRRYKREMLDRFKFAQVAEIRDLLFS